LNTLAVPTRVFTKKAMRVAIGPAALQREPLRRPSRCST
jgi:hypothetical protein